MASAPGAQPQSATARIRFDSWSEFARFMNQDGGTRGLFVRAATPPPIGTDLTVAFVLPDGSDLALPGRVVHRLSAEEASAMGEHAGMGVQFTHMSEEQAQRIQELMSNAEARASTRASQPVGSNVVQAAPRPGPVKAGAQSQNNMPAAPKLGAQSQNNMQAAAKPVAAAGNGAHAGSTATPANGQVRRPGANASASAAPAQDPRLHQAASMLERGRFDAAARLVGEMLDDNPDLVAGKVLANVIDARRLRAQFAFEDAIERYRAVLAIDPEHREASEQLAVLPQELDHSLKLYERVFGSKP